MQLQSIIEAMPIVALTEFFHEFVERILILDTTLKVNYEGK